MTVHVQCSNVERRPPSFRATQANLRSYFSTQAADLMQEHPERAIAAYVDFLDLASAPVFATFDSSSAGPATASSSLPPTPAASSSSIAADIREQPAIVLTCMGLAMYQALYDVYASDHDLEEPLPDTTILLYVCIVASLCTRRLLARVLQQSQASG